MPAASTSEIEILADSLSACADELHLRIMRAIRSNPADATAGASAPETAANAASAASTAADGAMLAQGISHQAAQDLFDQEVILRAHANRLYTQAAALAAAGLGAAREDLLDVAAASRRKMRRAARLQDLVLLAADIIVLAGAIATGKPEQLPATVHDIRKHFTQQQDTLA